MEYLIPWMDSSPSEDLPNVSNHVHDITILYWRHYSSYHHDNYPSIFMLIIEPPKEKTFMPHHPTMT